jgi:soluble lytic murein transglycosylase-like protein
MRFLGLILLAAVSAVSAAAAEYAVFASGARLRIDRHETLGSKVRLYDGDGCIELDLSRIQRFEPAEDDPSPAPPAADPVPVPTVAAPTAPHVAPSPQELADAAADKYGIPRKLVRLVMQAESGSQPQAVSPKGAIGLMQLMPGTAQALGVDPADPVQNVDAGARYLRDLLQKYDGLLWHALAAYNAGPAAVDKYNGIPPYNETILYVKKIDQQYRKSDN